MLDIQFTIDNRIRFQKKLWHNSEVILAKCLWFDTSDEAEHGIIHANMMTTSKRAIYEFVRICFKNFTESPMEEDNRTRFYSRVDMFYDKKHEEVDIFMKQHISYYKMLYAHQKETNWESFHRQFNFYAMDMGTVKTITSATLSLLHYCQRTLIICPAAVKWNWYRDLTTVFGFNELLFSILDSANRRRLHAMNEKYIICNYDIVGKFENHLLAEKIDHFILDEAHMLKNHNAKRYKNVMKIIEANPQAKITLLSGTPIKNRVNDLYGYFRMIGHELGSSYKKFITEYTITTKGRGGERVTGGQNLQDLYIKLSNFMIRRTKEECLDLPEKIYLSYKYEMDDYRDEYNKIIEELRKNKEMKSLTGNLHSLNIITSKAKLEGIKELAEQIIESDRKVVIFGGYKEPLGILEQYFGSRCVKVDGSVDSWSRDQHVQRFWNDPDCKVFLGNMQAAGVGINLTNASDIIFLNFPFTPSELYQATDRCHRIGQGNSVNVHYTFCEDSVDEYIYEIIVDKERDINVVIDQGKEVNLRENFTEILIKKLLGKDAVDSDAVSAETQPVVEEAKVEENSGQGIVVQGKTEILQDTVTEAPSINTNNVFIKPPF